MWRMKEDWGKGEVTAPFGTGGHLKGNLHKRRLPQACRLIEFSIH
jgi:hypothetical protein